MKAFLAHPLGVALVVGLSIYLALITDKICSSEHVLLASTAIEAPAQMPKTRHQQMRDKARARHRTPSTMMPSKAFFASADPISPLSWSVPNWYIDPANSIGCASDANSGTAATCTGGCSGTTCPSGIGPIKTWGELNVHRWGCQGNPMACPVLRQNTVINWLSGQSDNTDAIMYYPGLQNGAYTEFNCVLGAAQQVSSTTLTSVTPKNRAAGQLLAAAYTGVGAGQLVQNNTHPSRALTYKVGSGGKWNMSQPLTGQEPPITFVIFPTFSEVDTWAPGDAVVAYSPSMLDIVSIFPNANEFDEDFTFAAYVYGCGVSTFGPWTTEGDATGFGSNVYLIDSIVLDTGFFACGSMGYTGAYDSYVNFVETYSFLSGDSGTFLGGILNGIDTTEFFAFDQDAIMGAGSLFSITTTSEYNLGSVFVDSGSFIDFRPGMIGWLDNDITGATLWGPGSVSLEGNSYLRYKHSTAVDAFLVLGGLQMDGQTTACNHTGAAPDVITCGIALTPVNLDLAVISGGFGGTAFIPGGGTISTHY